MFEYLANSSLYGNRILEIKDGVKTINVGTLERLVPAMSGILSAVEPGEFDDQPRVSYRRTID